jgi:hypothetical protein
MPVRLKSQSTQAVDSPLGEIPVLETPAGENDTPQPRLTHNVHNGFDKRIMEFF